MKKLMFVLVLFTLSFTFSSCEQEEITPANEMEIPLEESTDGNDPGEDGGSKVK